jgi:cell division transport system permease protein
MPYALREALAAFRRSPLLAGLSVAMIALSLLVVGLFGIAAHNVRRVLDRVEARVEVVAYLKNDADFNAVLAAQAEMKKTPAVREVRYVSREQALEVARTELPEFQQLFGTLEGNPLPASIEVAMQPQQGGPDAVINVARRLAQFPFVEEVLYGREWLDKIYLLRRVAGAVSLVMGGSFALVAALIIGAAVRIAVFARRDEISIMRLVGATDSFIRRPFQIEGVMAGLGGGILALLFSSIAFRLMSRSLFQLERMPLTWMLAIVALGGLLGGMASNVAVRRHLREV